jgi:putative oxidoreductase
MNHKMSRWAEPIYSVFRIVSGLLFASHGAQKLFAMFPHATHKIVPSELPPQMKIGGVIELVCGLAIATGFQARWAAFLASGTMAVAYWQFHHRWDYPLPSQNDGELAVIYCFAFLYIAARGSGEWIVSWKGKHG